MGNMFENGIYLWLGIYFGKQVVEGGRQVISLYPLTYRG